jgi:rod shape-determining protein MreD
MRWLKFTLWTYLVFVLHSAFSTILTVAGYTPNLLLAGLVVITCRIAGRQGLLAAALWGLLADCLTESRLGAGMVCFSLAAYLLQGGSMRWNGRIPWRIAAFSLPLTWAAMVGMAVLRAQTDGRPSDHYGLCIHAAGSAIYTAVVIVAAEIAVRLIRGSSTAGATIAAPTVSNRWKMLTE